MYDYDNTGYYVDALSTSNIYAVTDYTRRGAFNLGRERGNRRDITGDTNHWTGTNGWGTSYGNWDTAWEGGFAGWDIWGGGTGHPQGGGYVHAQGIVSGQHYATSGGGTAYGWMMVGAHDALANRYWARGKWGGSTSGWLEFVMSNSNPGYYLYAYIMYDSNNTGYYVDPASGSNFNWLTINDWYYINGALGMYWNSYGRGFVIAEQQGNPYGHITTYGGGRNGWSGYGIGSRYTFMSTTGDNVGVHDSARGWVWYMSGAELNLYWAGADRMSMRSHGAYAHADVRASIYYDHNTSFYFNGDGDSRWNGLDDYSKMRIGLTGRGNFRRNDYTGDTGYWVGSMGWGTTDMNSVASWGSGFIDSWSNPPNQPSGTSHWVGTQAFHYAYGGNSNTGWQLVGGPISNLRFRNAWGGWSGWTTVAMHDRNDGSGGALYAGMYYDANNTGYYVDPNSQSQFSEIRLDGVLWSRNGYGRIFLGGNLHIDSYSHSIYMNYYTNNPMRFYGYLEMNGYDIYGVGGIYSTIFYDRNDTGYYANPNGYSQFSAILANNWFRPQGCCGLYFESYGHGIWSPECEGNSYGNIATYGGGRNGWSGYGIRSRFVFMGRGGDCGVHDNSYGWVWYWDTNFYMYYAGSERMSCRGWGVYVNQYLEAGGSVRGPIFYDNQDTGYYLDPHNTDNQGLRMRGGTLHGPNWYWGAYLRVGTNERVDGWASMFTSNGNLHIDSRNGYPMYLNWHNGNTVFVENDIRANIYYDRYDTGYYFYGRTDSRVYRWNANYLYAYGWIFAQDNIIAYYSDERLKTKLGPIEDALGKLSKLNGFYYVNNDLAKTFGYKETKVQLGLSAQEVQSVIPEIVHLAPFDTKFDEDNNIIGSKTGENYLTIEYDKVVPLLVEAIKEQQKIIENQNKEISDIKEMLNNILINKKE
jgi:hypothetical protein